jgi:hypothetical protein
MERGHYSRTSCSETLISKGFHSFDLEIIDDFPAHDGLKFLGTDFSGRIAELAISGHIHIVGLGHMDAMVLQITVNIDTCIDLNSLRKLVKTSPLPHISWNTFPQ